MANSYIVRQPARGTLREDSNVRPVRPHRGHSRGLAHQDLQGSAGLHPHGRPGRVRSFHLAEHHGTDLSMAPNQDVFIAAASQITDSIRLGPMVKLLPMHHPVQVVEDLCVLDHLTNGRLDYGVGRGAVPVEHAWHGGDFRSARERFVDYLGIIADALRSGEVSSENSEYLDFPTMPLTTGPLQETDPLLLPRQPHDGRPLRHAPRHGRPGHAGGLRRLPRGVGQVQGRPHPPRRPELRADDLDHDAHRDRPGREQGSRDRTARHERAPAADVQRRTASTPSSSTRTSRRRRSRRSRRSRPACRTRRLRRRDPRRRSPSASRCCSSRS